jgi:aspartate/methionine/tyrosine aminotransferase
MDYETPQFYRVMQYAARADRDVVDMVSGSPDWDPPAALRDGLRAYAEAPPDDYQYPPSEGLRSLRAEIARRRNVPIDHVLVTNGAGEANHLAMTGGFEAFEGREILLVDPVYPYYAGRANFIGAETRYVSAETDGQLSPDTLREAASAETSVIVVNSPNNPTGAVYPDDAMAEFVAIAEANDALLVSDEVYDHFDYSGAFASALEIESDHRIVTDAYSKTMAVTGLRVGYTIIEDDDLRERARTRHMLTNVTGSRPAQYAVSHALEATPPRYYAEARGRVRNRIDRLTDALDSIGAEYTDPDGGFYVLARFPGFGGEFEDVYDLIDKAGMAGMPGAAFGESFEEWIRFAVCTDRVETAAARLERFFA